MPGESHRSRIIVIVGDGGDDGGCGGGGVIAHFIWSGDGFGRWVVNRKLAQVGLSRDFRWMFAKDMD